MGCLYSRLQPCVSAKDTKIPVASHLVHRFPETEQEATAECIEILKNMEFRSVRAAKMAYNHSDWFDKMHLAMTGSVSLITAVTAFTSSTYFVQFKMKNITFKAIPISLTLAVLFTAGVTSFSGAWYYQDYDKLLPRIKEKHDKFNKAGAAWQKFELKLRMFRCASPQNDMSLKDIRTQILEFAEERQRICEIACPSKTSHKNYVRDYNDIIKRKWEKEDAIKRYFGNDESTDPTDNDEETWESVKTQK